MKMDISYDLGGLSRKSRGILYKLKKTLQQKHLTLDQHIMDVFQFKRPSFNLQQFTQIIKKYDQKLIYSDIDDLFEELDQEKNRCIFYAKLDFQINALTEKDNPVLFSKIDFHNSSISNTDKHKYFDIVLQIKQLLLSSDDLYEVLNLFDTERDGFLSRENINELLNNFGYENGWKRKLFLQNILEENKQRISIKQFMQIMDLKDVGERINLDDIQLQKSIILDINKSGFIKEQQQKNHILEESFELQKTKSVDKSELIQIENIPKALQPYYNYGSQLEFTFALYAQEYIENHKIFIDPDNPPYSQAYNWIHIAESISQNYHLFQAAKSVLQRNNHRKGLGLMLEPKDIIQGSLGDCYFLSAVAGVVQKYPELVYNLFVLEKNPSHIYGVRLFLDGAWRTIIVDACFPISRNHNFCCAQPHHQQIWVMLLEKAWAKAFKSYDNIHSGYNEQGLNAVSGAPSIQVEAMQNGFIRRVEVQLKRGSIISLATSDDVSQMTKSQQDELGIYCNHAYSLLDIFSNLEGKKGQNITLLRIRNPWGRKGWKGHWSFKSTEWTQTLRDIMNYNKDPNDGSFFMSYSDFAIYFDHVNICRINLSYTNSWTEVQADREQWTQTNFTVNQKGDYYITLYQENPRKKYKATVKYQKSKSWLILCQIKNGSHQAIGSSARDKRDNTLEVSLEKGEYVILSKIQWKVFDRYTYIISSYGPSKIKFKKQAESNIHLISDFIQSKAKLGLGKTSFYQNANVIKRISFDPSEGYGFILINNQENRVFETNIALENCKGLQILPPYTLPLKLQIFPFQQVLCKFIVDPRGYSYVLKENCKFLNSF